MKITIPDPIITQCDAASQAVAINNDNFIIGTSFDSNNNQRPNFWIKSEDTTDDGKPIYNSGDLGSIRVDLTPDRENTDNPAEPIPDESRKFTIVLETDNQVKGYLAGDSLTGLTERKFKTTFRKGLTLSIDKSNNAVVGKLQLSETDTNFKPVFWPGASFTNVDPPHELLSPELDYSQQGECPTDVYKEFMTEVNPTTLAGGTIGGWYQDANGKAKPINWIQIPCKDKNEITTDILEPKSVSTLDDNNFGKILDNNIATESIGTTEVMITKPDGQSVSESHAFYHTPGCGIQDLNDLFVTPEDKIVFEQATRIPTGNFPARIVATGRTVESGETAYYVLHPQQVFLDLSIDIASNHRRLTVGDKDKLFVTVSNNGSPDDPTKDKFSVIATIPQTGVKIEDEKLAGLSFLNYKASDEVYCVINRVSINCAIEKLLPGAENAISMEIETEPRPLLADRDVRTTAKIAATESEKPETQSNNSDYEVIHVDRKGCFIATAAYGSYLAPEVVKLRNFRDQVLLKTTAGTLFVELYYDLSPQFAEVIMDNPLLRDLARWTLTPLVYSVSYPKTALMLLILCISTFLFIRAKKTTM